MSAVLKTITLSAGTASPPFSPGRTLYHARVPHRVESVAVSAAAGDPGTRVSVHGAPADGGAGSVVVPLAVGWNDLRVEVSSPDGREKRLYTVVVTRAHSTPDWACVTEAAPWLPRDSAGDAVSGGRMWLFGGYTPDLVGDVWHSADGVAWTRAADIPNASGVNIPVALAFDGLLWVACNDGSLWATADGAVWSLINEAVPWKGRYAASGAVFRDRMWVAGGMGSGSIHNDVWSSADGIRWDLETAAAPWSRRQVFRMFAVHDDRLWVVGGGLTSYHPFRSYTDVWSSADGRAWTRACAEAPWPGRIWSRAVSYRGRLWVLGGFRAEPAWTNLADAWYSADGSSWRRLETETMWSPRHEICAHVHGGRLWVAGGNSWPLRNDVWSLEVPGLCFVTQPPVEELSGARYAYRAAADFHEGRGRIRYRLLESPGWLSIDGDSGLIEGTAGSPGEARVTVEAFDDRGETARQEFALRVLPVG